MAKAGKSNKQSTKKEEKMVKKTCALWPRNQGQNRAALQRALSRQSRLGHKERVGRQLQRWLDSDEWEGSGVRRCMTHALTRVICHACPHSKLIEPATRRRAPAPQKDGPPCHTRVLMRTNGCSKSGRDQRTNHVGLGRNTRRTFKKGCRSRQSNDANNNPQQPAHSSSFTPATSPPNTFSNLESIRESRR